MARTVPHTDSPTEIRRAIQKLGKQSDTDITDIQSDISDIESDISDIQDDIEDIQDALDDVEGGYIEGLTNTAEAAEDIEAGNVLYLKDDGTVALADCTNLDTSVVYGIALEDASTGEDITSRRVGRLELESWPLEAGEECATEDAGERVSGASWGNEWNGAVLANNGYIYCVPSDNSKVLKIDPADGSWTTIGSVSSSTYKWAGGALAGNGCIYCAPRTGATQVLKIDPSTDTVSLIGSTYSGSEKWWGAVLAGNGCIYCIPHTSEYVLKIDPTTDTTSTFGSLTTTAMKWRDGALGSNGCIYGVPWMASTIVKIDPTTDTASTFGSLSGGSKYNGAVTAENGNVYGIPAYATTILKIDVSTDTASTFGSVSGNDKYCGGVLADNGDIYCIPHDATTILRIDVGTETTSTFGSLSGTDKWEGGAADSDGIYIFGAPYDDNYVLKITTESEGTPPPTTFTLQDIYYLGESGYLTDTPPDDDSYVLVEIGQALSTTELLFTIQSPILL